MSNFNEIIRRFFSRSYSENDLKNLFLWFNSEKGNSEMSQEFKKNWKTFVFDNSITVDSGKLIRNIKKRIKQDKPSRFKQNFKQLIPYAAMLVFAFGFLFYYFINTGKNQSYQLPVNQEYTTVITESGQRSKVVLPDSSIVWLNSGTTLSYCDNFLMKRKIILDGQAFFQVARKDDNIFSVQCNDLIINVLGTKFDVNSYPENGKISVVLESGVVKLTHDSIDTFFYTMKPGELAEYNLEQKSINISNPDLSNYSSWKEGKLIFKDTPMNIVIDKLERWYNIQINVTNPNVYNSIFTGTIQNEGYEQIFRLIEYSCPVKCTIIKSESVEIPKIVIDKI